MRPRAGGRTGARGRRKAGALSPAGPRAGVAGAGRGARLEDAHRGHRPGRRRAWHHPRGLLRRGWQVRQPLRAPSPCHAPAAAGAHAALTRSPQERDPRQRLGGERPPRDRALVPRRRAAVLGGQRRALAVRVAPPAPPVCGPPWPAALTSISLHNKVKQILNAPPGLDPGTRSYDVKTFITYRADTWVRLQGQSLRRITTQPLPPAAPTRLAPESLHSPVGTDKGLDVHHSGEWQGGGEKPAAARGCGGGWLGLWGGCPRSVLLWWEVGGLQGLSSRSKAWTWAGQGGGSPGRHPAKPAGIHA